MVVQQVYVGHHRLDVEPVTADEDEQGVLVVVDDFLADSIELADGVIGVAKAARRRRSSSP